MFIFCFSSEISHFVKSKLSYDEADADNDDDDVVVIQAVLTPDS